MKGINLLEKKAKTKAKVKAKVKAKIKTKASRGNEIAKNIEQDKGISV